MGVQMRFLLKVLAGLFLGIVVGLILGQEGTAFANTYIAPVGKVFLRLLKMMIVPLVFTSIVVGVSSLDDVTKLGRIGGKTMVLYLLTTFVAVALAIMIGVLLQPGMGLHIPLPEGVAVNLTAGTSFGDALIDIFPTNIVRAMAEDNMMQIIVFSLLVGVALAMFGKETELVNNFFQQSAKVCYKVIGFVIKLTPFGVFALTVPIVVQNGTAVFLPLLKLLTFFVVSCLLHVGFVYGFLLLASGLNPLQYFKNVMPAFVMALGVRSSSVTLPVTVRCCKKMNISDSLTSFILPLGAVVNMDGTAIYEGICAVFVAQVYGIELGMAQYAMIAMTGTLASIGNATVPGSSFVMLTMVLSAVGLPLEGTALVAGVECVMDMLRTGVNVIGDSVVCGVVAKSEGESVLS